MRLNKFSKALRLVGFAGAVLTAGAASAADVFLKAESFDKMIADNTGGTIPVKMWGFASCTDNTFTTCEQAISPGPQIDADPAGGALTIHVNNTLKIPVSVVIPGLAGAGDPVMMTDTQGRQRVRSLTKETAPGATESYTWALSTDDIGTYLYHSGSAAQLEVPMGLYGAVVIKDGATAYSGVTNNKESLVLISELDPVQNQRVHDTAAAVVDATGYPGAACVSITEYKENLTAGYPCTVDYFPAITLINGETSAELGTAPGTAIDPGDTVLLRMLNAGQRTHVLMMPNVELNLVAEDGNLYPGNPRVQSEAMVSAGKTLDATFQTVSGVNITYSMYDHMPTYKNVANTGGGQLGGIVIGTGTPVTTPTTYAVNDEYAVSEDNTYISNVSVTNNDVGLTGATNVVPHTGVSNGTLNLGTDGKFDYTPDLNFSGSDAFSYIVTDDNGSYQAQVKLNVSFENDAPVANPDGPYTNTLGTTVKVDAAHGVLGNDSDPDGDPLTAVLVGNVNGLTLNPDGSFEYTGTTSTSFSYRAHDGTIPSPGQPVSVDIIVGTPSNIALNVTEPDGITTVGSYRWIVQEDLTFHVDPASPANTADMLAVNFHRSYMPVVAQGCVGTECATDNPEVPVAEFSEAVLDQGKKYYVSVLPNDAGAGVHTIGGANIPIGTVAGDTINVIVNNQPIPTAQISVLIFEDNAPTNGAPDGGEPGLGGFVITLEDAAGTFGSSPGFVQQDVDGNPLKNSLACFDADGNPVATPDGSIVTCPDGRALIKGLPPGKYGVIAQPPVGSGTWTQSSTIEGTKVVDAWVGPNEPPFLVEFGGAAPHVFTGFVNPANTIRPVDANGQPLPGNNTITGFIDLLHTSRPPDATFNDSGNYNALAHTRPWIGLNSNSGTGPNIATVPADVVEDADGNLQAQFTIDNVPDGNYQLAIWDDYLDQIISYQAVNVSGGNGGDVGRIMVPVWFGRNEHTVYIDKNENGERDIDPDTGELEAAIAEQNINLRFRDGSVYQSFPTDLEGFVPFDQVFPFLNWLVAEVDFARYKATGMKVWVDGGGDVDPATSNTPFPGLLNPQVGSPRVETGAVLTQAFQEIMGNTSIFEWGKKPYLPGENGGISGIVFYGSTRGENDPRLTVGDTWEPGIPDVTVRLHKEIEAMDKDNPPKNNFPGVEDVDYNGNGILDLGKSLTLVQETTTDSWDNSLPTDCPGEDATSPLATDTLAGDVTRCYDAYRNFDQVRPGVFDGGYAFGDLKPGNYVVEVVPPVGYEIIKEEDKNVDFGDVFEMAPAPLLVGGALVVIPDYAMVAEAKELQWGLAAVPCVGPMHTVPATLSLFPGEVDTYAPYAGADRPLCNMKSVVLSDQANAAADFHLFTSAPVAGQYTGLSTDDIVIETNQRSPLYADKHGPSFMPITQRDWMGNVLYSGYTDAFGKYNGMVPSTYSANLPIPSGFAPGMHSVCLNDKFKPDGTTDPFHLPQYASICYEFMYMPGKTTYLDTPILPQSAFAAGYNPVDCALPDGYPKVASVENLLVSPGSFMTLHSAGIRTVPNPDYEGPSAPAPHNVSKIDRNYGFGNAGSVMLGDTSLTDVSWNDATITGKVPAGLTPGDYELVVVSADGKQSVNTVTITVGSETAKHVPGDYSTIQAAIDNAAAGDLIIVAPGTYNEQVIMWKPVRLQGSGADTIINAIALPPSVLNDWQTRVEGLIADGLVSLLPTQEVAANGIGAAVFGTEQGAGIMVLASNDPTKDLYIDNPSRIDGFTITSADGGGGITVNGYAHNLVISNNNVTGNSGILHGGIRIGAPELGLETTGPFGFNTNVNIHHNSITLNGAQTGVAVGGGVAICTGTDNYSVNHNFICGNFNLGSGGGITHYGLSNDGVIANNQILFNQNFNQGLGADGGGVLIKGEPALVTALTLGTGNVDVDSNLIKGNEAASGHGGGIRTQAVNGNDVAPGSTPWKIRMLNNIVVNNVAGWAGGGISMLDTINAEIVLNTIANNDTVGTAGAVLNSGEEQPSGIASDLNSLGLNVALTALDPAASPFSDPLLQRNIIRHNRAFTFNANATTGLAELLPVLAPAAAGDCAPGAHYNDLGVLSANAAHTLDPRYSFLTSTTGYHSSNSAANPFFVNEYCNTSRTLTAGGIEPIGPIVVAVEPVEGGNAASVRWGPLTHEWNGSGLWDYHIYSISPAIDYASGAGAVPGVDYDIDNDTRPIGAGVEVGADETAFVAGTVALGSATGNAVLNNGLLNFGVRPGSAGEDYFATVTLTVSGGPVLFDQIDPNGLDGSSLFRIRASANAPADTCSGNVVTTSCVITVRYSNNTSSIKHGVLNFPHNGTGATSLDLIAEDPGQPLTQCSDGSDNDGDNLIDLADPGCVDANDNDETDPLPPPPAAQCSDGIDNDGDNLIDFPADAGCTDANDNDETDPPPAGNPGVVALAGATGDAVLNNGLLNFGVIPGSGGNYYATVTVTVTGDPVTFGTMNRNGIIGSSLFRIRASADYPENTCSGNVITTSCVITIRYRNRNGIRTGTLNLPHNGTGVTSMDIVADDPGQPIVVEPPVAQCNDGIDNDGDNLIDLADPGCVDANDNDETDPAPPGGAGVAFVSSSHSRVVYTNGTLDWGSISSQRRTTVTLSASGGAVTFGGLIVDSPDVNGGRPRFHHFSSWTDTCSGNTIPDGGSCQFQLRFDGRNGSNPATGTLTIPHDGSGLAVINLTGR